MNIKRRSWRTYKVTSTGPWVVAGPDKLTLFATHAAAVAYAHRQAREELLGSLVTGVTITGFAESGGGEQP